MITLGSFRCDQSTNSRRFSCDVTHEHLPETLFFDCKGNNLLPVDAPSCNWAAVAMLFPAMEMGEDLKIEGPVSPDLLFALNGDVQSLLIANQQQLKRISVIAEVYDPVLNTSGTEVATAFSAGIDSFATLDIYTRKEVPDAVSITTLTSFNVGAIGDTNMSKDLFPKYCARLKNFAKKSGFNWQTAQSNLDDFYNGEISKFKYTVVIRNAACAYLFEDQYKTYLHSSSYPYQDIKASNWGMASVEPILLPLLSTERLHFISAGAGLTRVEKTQVVSDMEVARDLLDVCESYPGGRAAKKFVNCGNCWKCARTLITLELLGKRDDFAKMFDIEKFESRKANLIFKIARQKIQGNQLDSELVNLMYENNYKGMPVWMKVLCFLGFAKHQHYPPIDLTPEKPG